MTSTDIIQIIDSGEIDKLKSSLEVSKYAYFVADSFGATATLNQASKTPYNQVDDFKQYHPKQHDVQDKAKRPDKAIKGEDNRTERVIPITRLSLPEQKKIVLFAATFLGSPSLLSNPKEGIETEMLQVIRKIFDDNKLQYKFKNISKTTMSERECAELWYTQEAEEGYWDGSPMSPAKYKLRMRILSPTLGDTLYPVYDSYGDMVAFGRYYETVEAVPGSTEKSNKIYHFDVYTKDRYYYMTKPENSGQWEHTYDPSGDKTGTDGTITKTKGLPNVIGKIPVIYYSQPATEWHDVQEMIDRLERKISNHADTNDYFDSPIVFAEGDVQGFSEKGEQGKVLTGKNNAKVSYLTWDNAPESMKLEIENLIKFIHSYTHTPDISFNNMKSLGTFSGIALKMFFMDAHLKASDKEEIFGEGVQRRINYIKKAISVLNQKFKPALSLVIEPKFTYFLPKDVDGEVNTIVKAYGAGIISLETAVKLNPLVQDAVAELERIKSEQENTSATEPAAGGGVIDSLGKIPLALQQLSLAATRAQDAGDTALANRLNNKMDELLATI